MSTLQIDVEQFLRRVIADAMLEAEVGYWLRRALDFRQAAARPGDYVGQAKPGEVAEQRARCLATAHACEARAQYLRLYADDRPNDVEVEDAWQTLPTRDLRAAA